MCLFIHVLANLQAELQREVVEASVEASVVENILSDVLGTRMRSVLAVRSFETRTKMGPVLFSTSVKDVKS